MLAMLSSVVDVFTACILSVMLIALSSQCSALNAAAAAAAAAAAGSGSSSSHAAAVAVGASSGSGGLGMAAQGGSNVTMALASTLAPSFSGKGMDPTDKQVRGWRANADCSQQEASLVTFLLPQPPCLHCLCHA